MLNDYERYFEISLPREHQLVQLETDEKKRAELRSQNISYNTRAISEIRELFGSDVFFLKETRSAGGNGKSQDKDQSKNDTNGFTVTYQVAVLLHKEKEDKEKEAKLEKFRQSVAQLGFNVREISGTETRR